MLHHLTGIIGIIFLKHFRKKAGKNWLAITLMSILCNKEVTKIGIRPMRLTVTMKLQNVFFLGLVALDIIQGNHAALDCGNFGIA